MDNLKTVRRLLRALSDEGAADEILFLARLIELERRASPHADARGVVNACLDPWDSRENGEARLANHPMRVLG